MRLIYYTKHNYASVYGMYGNWYTLAYSSFTVDSNYAVQTDVDVDHVFFVRHFGQSHTPPAGLSRTHDSIGCVFIPQSDL